MTSDDVVMGKSYRAADRQVELKIGSTTIQDTFAEAFSMQCARVVVTAHNQRWLDAAVAEFSGYGSSVIGCDAEVGLERLVGESETLDGRPGASLLIFGFSNQAVEAALCNRAGQCLMTCPTTAVFDGLVAGSKRDAGKGDGEDEVVGEDQQDADTTMAGERISLGKQLRFFGDGFQKSKLIGERRFWRVPVMDGEFIVEDSVCVTKGVAGGNFLILATDQIAGLGAAERAVDQIAKLDRVITPFPGGVVRSGSKVGSRYPKLKASTSEAFCPTLRGRIESKESKLPPEVGCVYEIVIDGTDFESVAQAIKTGVQAAAGEGVVEISSGNFDGKLGKHHFYLHELLKEST